MQIYKVDYADYFAFADAPEIKEYFDRSHALCHEPMTQLIKQYGLQNKRILSVGSSVGFEEYCFYENNCALTFCDIDESQKIESYLKQLKPATEDRFLTFVIGDAQELTVDEKFDMCYFSSFTPNELRNRYGGRIKRFMSKPIWHDKPFDEIVSAIIDRSLKAGGFFIYQSYSSEVDASKPEYVSAVKRQLHSLGIELVDVYYYESLPYVHLIVAARGKVPELKSEITVFHGRGEPAKRGGWVRKSYQLPQ